jgi:predicted porin
MIKKLLPTMIGAALVGGMAPAAADVTVFGHIDTSIDYVDQYDDTTNLNSNTSSIGFKGSEDLGNGLKAIFKIDFQYDTTERRTSQAKSKSSKQQEIVKVGYATTTSGGVVNVTNVTDIELTTVTNVTSVSDDSSITDRDQWLGLAGSFGKIRFGTISTLYKSHGAMIDPLYRTSVQARGIGLQSTLHKGAGENGQGRAEDTIRYDSPNWNGLQVGATYTLQTETQRDNDSDSPFGVGVQYKNGPFLVFADYITNDNGGDDDAYKAGGKWTFGNYSLYGQYEVDGGLISHLNGTQGLSSSGNTRNKGDGADVWEIGGTAKFGNNMIVAAYGSGDDTSGNGLNLDAGYDVFEIVGVHSFSKRTSVYGGYANVSFDGDDELGDNIDDKDIVTLGMKHKF